MGLQSAEIELTLERLKKLGATEAQKEAAVRKIYPKYASDGSTLKATGKIPTVDELRKQVNAAYPLKKKAAAAKKKPAAKKK